MEKKRRLDNIDGFMYSSFKSTDDAYTRSCSLVIVEEVYFQGLDSLIRFY